MRCSKCGYISFDHLRQCRKCNTDLAELSLLLAGTALHLAPVNFLAAMYEEDEAPQYEIEVSIEEGEPALDLTAGEEAEISLAAADLELSEEEMPTIALAGEESLPELTLTGEEPASQPATEQLPELHLEAEPEPALALEPESPAAALAGLSLETEEELVPPALSLEEEGTETASSLPELSLLDEEEVTASPDASGEAADAELPILDLGEEPLPVGTPAPLRQTDDITLGLEEINLSDLVSGEEAEELALDEGGGSDETSLEEELFDLSDILSDADDSAK